MLAAAWACAMALAATLAEAAELDGWVAFDDH